MRAIDTHAHLDFPDYDSDREQLIRSLEQQSIGVITIAADLDSNRQTDDLSSRYPLVWGTLGIHPTDVDSATALELPKILDQFTAQIAENPKLVAIGEIGLDYFRDSSHHSAQLQKTVFRALLSYAKEKNLPVSIHCREAFGDTITILRDYPGINGVLHCFNGTAEQAAQLLELGFYISFTGMLTYPKNSDLRSVSARVPLERLLLETDAPFLAPQSRRGERNDSTAILEIAATHAEIRNCAVEKIEQQTTENALRLFGIEAA